MRRYLTVFWIVIAASAAGCVEQDAPAISPGGFDAPKALLTNWNITAPLLDEEIAWTISVANDTSVSLIFNPGEWETLPGAESSGVWAFLNGHDRNQYTWGREYEGTNSSLVMVEGEEIGDFRAGPDVLDPREPLLGSIPLDWSFDLQPGHHHLVLRTHRAFAEWPISLTARGQGGFSIQPLASEYPLSTVLAYPGDEDWTATAAASLRLTGTAVLNTTVHVDYPFNLLHVAGTALSQTRIEGPETCDFRLPYNHGHRLWNAPPGHYELSAETFPPLGGPPNALAFLIQLPGHEDVDRATRCS